MRNKQGFSVYRIQAGPKSGDKSLVRCWVHDGRQLHIVSRQLLLSEMRGRWPDDLAELPGH